MSLSQNEFKTFKRAKPELFKGTRQRGVNRAEDATGSEVKVHFINKDSEFMMKNLNALIITTNQQTAAP